MSLSSILQGRERDVIQVGPDMAVREVAQLLADHRIGAVPVVKAGEVVGIFSERDIVYGLSRDGAAMLDWPVERVMTRPAITVESTTTSLQGLSLMTQRRIRHLPVVDEGRLVGFVSIGDLVKARMEMIEAEAEAMRSYITG